MVNKIIKKITRQEEGAFPDFSSHEEARGFFKDKYGDAFLMTSSDVIDDRKIYFYYLILDRKVFAEGQEILRKDGHMVDALDYMNSHQPVEIWENGDIHVIY